MRKWRVEDSAELYNINNWGINYFSINEKGHVVVTPREGCASVDLRELVDELQLRDVSAPMLIRFPDIIDTRIEKIDSCFKEAAKEYDYKGKNFIVFPTEESGRPDFRRVYEVQQELLAGQHWSGTLNW